MSDVDLGEGKFGRVGCMISQDANAASDVAFGDNLLIRVTTEAVVSELLAKRLKA